MKHSLKKWLIVGLIVLGCIALDQGSKLIAINNLVEYHSVPVIKGFFYWTLCYNPGGAWSIFSDNTLALIIISIVALGVLIFTMFKSRNKMYDVASSVFMGGLIGNLIDRVINHEVTDFIDFIIFGYDFPVFNLADIFICVSAAFIVLSILKEEKENGIENSN